MKIIDDNLINGVAEYGMVWNVWNQAFCWNARKVRLLNMR